MLRDAKQRHRSAGWANHVVSLCLGSERGRGYTVVALATRLPACPTFESSLIRTSELGTNVEGVRRGSDAASDAVNGDIRAAGLD